MISNPTAAALHALDALVGAQKARVDEGLQDLPRRLAGLAFLENGKKLLGVPSRAGSVRRHQVAKQLPDDGRLRRADAIQGNLGVMRQGTSHAPDGVVGFPCQDSVLSIPLFPELRGGEGEKRKRASLLAHFRDHFVDERLVLESVAAGESGLHQSSPQRALAQGSERRELREDGRERFMLLAVEQKVVPQRQEHVNVRLESEPAEKLGEGALDFGEVLGEELFELVDDDERLLVASRQRETTATATSMSSKRSRSCRALRVAREGRHQSLGESLKGPVARSAHDRCPPFGQASAGRLPSRTSSCPLPKAQ